MTTTAEHDDVVARSVAAYSSHTDDYATYNAGQVAETVARFVRELAPGSRILDAGCGPGRDLVRFVDAGHHPVGVDLNADFAAMARVHAPVHVADLRALPFDDDSFDAVWACASLVHLPPSDAAAALAELRRVARPEAPVCVSVKHSGDTGWVDTAHGHRWFQIWEPGDFASAVHDAGFDVVAIETGPVFVDVWATA